jgi:aminoglycoside phosphotransferase (APT) family kinase protein
MADVAPAGVDLGWMVFLHFFFQNIAEVFELPGLPGFMRPRDVADEYERLTGTHLTDEELRWYVAYAATRHGVVMFRIARRSALFEGTPMTDDPDEMINHGNVLRAILDGTYWPQIGL